MQGVFGVRGLMFWECLVFTDVIFWCPETHLFKYLGLSVSGVESSSFRVFFRVSDLRSMVHGLWFMVYGLWSMVEFRVLDLYFMVYGSWF